MRQHFENEDSYRGGENKCAGIEDQLDRFLPPPQAQDHRVSEAVCNYQ